MGKAEELNSLRPYINSFDTSEKYERLEAQIEEFLRTAEHLKLDRTDKLISLVCSLNEELGWQKTCKIFEMMNQELRPREQSGVYVVWLGIYDKWISPDSHKNFETRLHVAEDMLPVLKQFIKVSPNNPGAAWSFGKFYYDHPLRERDKTIHIDDALRWLEIASDWSNEQKDETIAAYTLVYQGHCYRALGEWNKALPTYELVDREQLEEEGDELSLEALDKNIEECKQYNS